MFLLSSVGELSMRFLLAAHVILLRIQAPFAIGLPKNVGNSRAGRYHVPDRAHNSTALSLGILRNKQESRLKLHWIHAPKTGTSFCVTLLHDRCWEIWPKGKIVNDKSKNIVFFHGGMCDVNRVLFPRGADCSVQSGRLKSNWNQDGHGPLELHAPNDNVVIVFRNPTHRIISSFFDRHHVEGMSKIEQVKLHDLERSAAVNECGKYRRRLKVTNLKIKRTDFIPDCVTTAKLRAYANATKGCMVRMLNGFDCYDISKPPTDEMVRLAVQRMKQFYFIGIFERWDEMINLFNAKRGHHCKGLSNFDHVHYRQGHYKYGAETLKECEDEADRKTYETAVEIYETQKSDIKAKYWERKCKA